MRDQHKPKQDLINEVVGLRKQVADLKEAAVARWRAEEALRRSEEQYRALVEYVPGAICRVAPDGRFVQVNAAFAELLGFDTRGEVVENGRSLGIFSGDSERDRVLDAFRTGTVRDLPAQLRRRDGSLVGVRLSGRAVRGQGNEIESFAILVTPGAESA
jgi:PAS domain S-box-containing protein